MRAMPRRAGFVIQEGEALHGVGGDGSDADHPLPANGADRRHEGVRQLSQARTKVAEQISELAKQGKRFGVASCDACHTRHTFSADEARQPQACETCHMGFDHPQWEMYSSSKHGVRYSLKQLKIQGESTTAPTCQTCHMQNGNHEVRAAWGFLAVKLPLPADKRWAADQATILQALGVLDPDEKPTKLVDVIQAADVARLDQVSWQTERDKTLNTCKQCHAGEFAKLQLQYGDDMIRNADHLMAEAIRTVAGLYKDGLLPKAASYSYAFPNLLAFHDAPTSIEQKLFVMFLEHRMHRRPHQFRRVGLGLLDHREHLVVV
jgi:hypothetical protein